MESLRVRLFPVRVELALLVAWIFAWQAAKAPLEASRAVAVAHAREWHGFERTLGIAVERDLVSFAQAHGALADALLWCYDNVHLPAMFGMLAAVRLLRPERWPWLRTTFVLLHLPVLLVTGVFPTAPPLAVPGLLPAGAVQPAAADGLLSNATAAAASIHFAWACCVALGAVLLAARRRWTLVLVAYPAWNLLVIVGTGNHFVLDAILGAGCLALAGLVAWLVLRGAPPARAARGDRPGPVPGARPRYSALLPAGARPRAWPPLATARLVAGVVLAAYALEAESSTLPPHGLAYAAAVGAVGAILILRPERLPALLAAATRRDRR